MNAGEVTISLRLDTTEFDKQMRRLRRQSRWLRIRNRWLLWFTVGATSGAAVEAAIWLVAS